MNEDELLDSIAVERVLSQLSGVDRVMMLLVYGIEFPDDWGARPVTFTTIGEYIGIKFEGAALSEAAIRYRRDVLLQRLRGGLRRSRRGRKKSL